MPRKTGSVGARQTPTTPSDLARILAKLNRDELLKALNGGASRDDAAHHAGVAPSELRAVLSAGDDAREQGKRTKAQSLLVAVERQEALLRIRLHAQINAQGNKDWRASLELLRGLTSEDGTVTGGDLPNLWMRVLRAQAIAEDRATVDEHTGKSRPMPWPEVAAKHGISERQVMRIYRDHCRFQRRQGNPLQTINEAIELRERMLEHLGTLAITADQGTARVGAVRAMLDVDRERLELMQAAGRLPRNMARFRAEADFMALARQMVEVLRKRDVPAEVVEELRSLAERHLPQQDNVRELRPAGSS